MDIDGESSKAKAQHFITLVKEFKKALPSNKILTYDAYQDEEKYPDLEVIRNTWQMLDWVNLMAYWDNPSEYEALYRLYLQNMSSTATKKLVIGAGAGFSDRKQWTPLDRIKDLCALEANSKRGMMFYELGNDCASATGHPNLTWTNEVLKWVRATELVGQV